MKHYKIGGIETIEYLRCKMSREKYLGFLLGNVIKYLSRHEHKGSPKQDISKAIDYLNMYYFELKEDDEND